MTSEINAAAAEARKDALMEAAIAVKAWASVRGLEVECEGDVFEVLDEMAARISPEMKLGAMIWGP